MNELNTPLLKTISMPPFPVAEYSRRIDEARRLMEEHGMDALLVTSEHNLRYFTGEPSATPFQTTRPRFLIIPLSGEPIAVVPRGIDEFYAETTWLREIRTWPGPNPADEGVTALSDTLSNLLSINTKIGTELGPESRLGLPVADFLRIAEILRPRIFVDASGPIFTKMRMVKSPAEVDRIRVVCELVSDGFVNLPPRLATGMTVREACRCFELECFVRGVEKTTRINAISGRGGYTRPYGVPDDTILSKGSLLYLDAGCLFDFYWSDFCRHFSFGSPDPHTKEAYEIVWDATEAGIAAVRPGMMFCEIWSAMNDVLSDPRHRGKATTVGRMGHSMGLWMPELPSVHPQETTVLEPGMIINIEPNMSYPGYHDGSPKLMVQEEVVVVTERGAELLTGRSDRVLTVVD